jgi:plasmid stability protein
LPSLLIRNLDVALHARIEARALAHHRSVEEEARETLRGALPRKASAVETDDLMAIATRFFGPDVGIDLELPRRTAEAERAPLDFSNADFDGYGLTLIDPWAIT